VKQPLSGILAAILVMAISLAFISRFDYGMFSGWVAYFLLCIIPMEIVIGVTWGTNFPAFAGSKSQPVKGILLALVALAAGVVVSTVYWFVAGGQVSPPAPMLAQCTISSVAITFWWAIMWGGWPFTSMIKNSLAAGLALLVGCYVLNLILFKIFFDYAFMQGAPVYVASLDPHGMFNAWHVLVFELSALSVLFLMALFDLWPFTNFPGIMKQPVLGIVWTVTALIIGAIAYQIAVNQMGMDPVAWMVKGPVPFIFGTIIMLNMLQNSVFGKFKQPLRGVLNLIAAIIVGQILAQIYLALAPTVTGQVNPGPPAYEQEIWLASALLSVTFPFLVMYADFFKFWPLVRAETPAMSQAAAEAGR